jgi:deoxyribonuclease-4
MAILGAHTSIAGGYHRAVERGRQIGCDCVQLFTKNNNQWRAKPITRQEAERFQAALRETGITHPIAHDCYLINLASPDRTLWRRSVRAMAVELRRADRLGIPYVVAHPGAYTTGNEADGLRWIVRALDEIHEATEDVAARCLLENTAGQGTSIGWRFEQLAAILEGVAETDRLGVCFDTCHAFAAGYALDTPERYAAPMRNFDRTIGLGHIKAFHLNDSKRPLGSRVDRHEHVGRGQMGREPFRLLLADRRFRAIPMYLETPKGEENGTSLDEINLATLRELAAE